MPVNLMPPDEPEDNALRELDEILAEQDRYGPDNLPRTPTDDELRREYTVADPTLLRRPAPICRDPVERRRRYLRKSGRRDQYEREFGANGNNKTTAR